MALPIRKSLRGQPSLASALDGISMRTITRAFCLVSCVWVLGLGGCAQFSGELSHSDMECIRAVVAKQSNEPIMSAERRACGVVRVQTGEINAAGWMYYLKRSGSTWRVKKAAAWTPI